VLQYYQAWFDSNLTVTDTAEGIRTQRVLLIQPVTLKTVAEQHIVLLSGYSWDGYDDIVSAIVYSPQDAASFDDPEFKKNVVSVLFRLGVSCTSIAQ
jgi:hypothetical protein